MKKLLRALQTPFRVLYGLVVVMLALMRMLPQPAPEHGAATPRPASTPAAPREEDHEKHPIEPESPGRRRFMFGVVGLTTAGIGAVIGVPVIAFLISPLTQKPSQQWRDVGPVDNFPAGSMTEVKLENAATVPWDGTTAQQGVWLRRIDETQFQAFEINCTHLGCPVHWIDTARLFLCPCHGGVFYEDGSVAAPPPARPLVQHQVRIVDGHVQVMTHALPVTGHFLHPGKAQ